MKLLAEQYGNTASSVLRELNKVTHLEYPAVITVIDAVRVTTNGSFFFLSGYAV